MIVIEVSSNFGVVSVLSVKYMEVNTMRISVRSIVKKENIVYLTALDINAVLSFDMNTKVMKLIGQVPEEASGGDRLFGELLVWNDSIVFVPYNAANIWIADEKFRKWEKIELDYPEVKMKFASAVIMDDVLYLPKHGYPVSLCVDLNTLQVRKMENMCDDGYLSSYLIGNYIYLPCIHSNRVIKYDIFNKNYSEIHIGEPDNTYNYLFYDKGIIYALPRKGKNIILIQKDQEIGKIELPDEILPRGIFPFDNKLYIPSSIKDKSFILQSGKLGKAPFNAEFIFSISLDDEIQCLADVEGHIYLFDLQTGNVETIDVVIEENVFDEIIGVDSLFRGETLWSEKKIRDFSAFAKYLIGDTAKSSEEIVS